MPKVRSLALLAGLGAVGAAVAQELRKPPAERTWHGRLAGVVPYEFRPPTRARVMQRFWNPDDPRVFTEHVFGVGWSVNAARLVQLARQRRG